MADSKPSRTDDRGAAYAGSQLQIQIYVNCRVDELNRAVQAAFPALGILNPHIQWVSPLEAGQFAEYKDSAFLKAVALEGHMSALNNFWPTGGPVWDGLAIVKTPCESSQNGIILLEAKSYPDEMRSGGCGATDEKSIRMIKDGLAQTKRWLGVGDEPNWLGSLYQSANRLAHLYFFREVLKIPAWMVNVCFVGDSREPTSRPKWDEALEDVKKDLGLEGRAIPHIADIFLPAQDRAELVGPARPGTSGLGATGQAAQDSAMDATRAVRDLSGAISKLKDLGIIRSRRFIGDLGEWYVATLWGARMSNNQVEKGWDLKTPEGVRLQVKTQTYDRENRWNYLDSDLGLFDRLIAVILNDDFTIRDLYDVPAAELKGILRKAKEGKDARQERKCYTWDDLGKWRAEVEGLPGYPTVKDLIRGRKP